MYSLCEVKLFKSKNHATFHNFHCTVRKLLNRTGLGRVELIFYDRVQIGNSYLFLTWSLQVLNLSHTNSA